MIRTICNGISFALISNLTSKKPAKPCLLRYVTLKLASHPHFQLGHHFRISGLFCCKFVPPPPTANTLTLTIMATEESGKGWGWELLIHKLLVLELLVRSGPTVTAHWGSGIAVPSCRRRCLFEAPAHRTGQWGKNCSQVMERKPIGRPPGISQRRIGAYPTGGGGC